MTDELRRVITMIEEYGSKRTIAYPYCEALVRMIHAGEHLHCEPWEEIDAVDRA